MPDNRLTVEIMDTSEFEETPSDSLDRIIVECPKCSQSTTLYHPSMSQIRGNDEYKKWQFDMRIETHLLFTSRENIPYIYWRCCGCKSLFKTVLNILNL